MFREGAKMLFTVSDDGIFTANCELYIFDKRNAAMQFIIDTGATITCCRAKELGVNLKEQDFIANKSNIKYLNGVLKEGKNGDKADKYSIRFYTCLLGQDIMDKLYYLHLRDTNNLLISDNILDLKRYLDIE